MYSVRANIRKKMEVSNYEVNKKIYIFRQFKPDCEKGFNKNIFDNSDKYINMSKLCFQVIDICSIVLQIDPMHFLIKRQNHRLE